ncbi:MAG TPA: GDP-mannose 4,6-dehydratase, partial [Methanomicrobiales archaeon]|nr:GDP-mannose 4,6-dehydratase [Methanomicrobiales archaeon]
IKALRNELLPIYGKGKNIRDWLYVEDNCSGIDTVLRKGKAGQVYNIASGEEHRNIDVARLVLTLTGRPESLISFVADRPGHDLRYSIRTAKVRKLGWRPAHSFEKGMEDTVAWYRANEGWWGPLV